MNKFWNWKNRKVRNDAEEETTERILELRGTIADFPAAVTLRSTSILRAATV